MSAGSTVAVQLQDLLDAIAHTTGEVSLTQAIAVKAGRYFSASRCKLFYVRDLLKFQAIASISMRKSLSLDSHPVLTSREHEIAELVAKGLTNKKIGEALWITENSVKQALKRMYRKLEVSSRAEMVAHISKHRWWHLVASASE